MRLGYLVPEFPSQTHIFFWREVQALRRLGDEVFILSTRKPPSDACKHDFAKEAVAATHYLFPPGVVGLTGWLLGGLTGAGQAFAYLRQLDAPLQDRLRQLAYLVCAIDLVQWARKNRIDHIHGHSCADSAHILALSKRMGGPSFSLTLHGDLDVYGRDHRAKFAEAAFVSAVGKHLCDQIIERTGLPECKVLPTFMGIETSRLAALGLERASQAGALRLVTIARLHPNKGHFHALAAVRRARDEGLNITYTIAGEGMFREAIVTKIGELGLRDSVKLTGTVSENEVFQLLSDADAFLLTSVGKGEAWPVSVMEAMGAGLPVISSIIGATPEMIRPGVDGFLVPQRDEDAIFEKIMILARNVQERQQIGAAARMTSQNRFDVSASAGVLRESICAQRKAAACSIAESGGRGRP
ncbi:glycosyltransferase [Bradyrhizobium sp. SRL28]|uniref:glycosyltransferase n=1 Tax=Bradyrhizobium sp. SRL28 TaxID=2836178 RepID=UPI001BDE87CB|nr:glycosyltransferase [Bradyrhizobium sp. SRL28]MBT1515632.1 glycosyltransferase [Bradyrhizobium sp. SRL28]